MVKRGKWIRRDRRIVMRRQRRGGGGRREPTAIESINRGSDGLGMVRVTE
jgi:hypothetical protein